MEDDDIDLLLALQPDDGEQGNAQASAFHAEAAGSPPAPAGGTSARAYHSPEADKTSGPRSKVSLSAAFGRASASAEGKAKVQKTAAPTGEAPKGKPRQVPGKGDNVEAHSGLRIKNRLLPTIVVKERFAGTCFLRLSKLSSAFQGGTPGSPWATVAVLSEKMTPRESASGRKYGLWKLTDLAGFTCTLFLFGDAFEAHWKESEGSVVGLVNAKYKEEGGARSSAPFSLSADSGQQVFKLGTSADLGLCGGTRKDGMPCTMPINKSEGDYCQYHAAGAYQKLQKLQRAQEKGHRMDLGKGKLSREPHGRVMNNVYVSAAPVTLPRVSKSGAVNVVKPGQLQEMAEQEQRKRSNSQGSRQALAIAALIQQQQEKKADKDRKKVPSKPMTDGPGASRTGPAKAPPAATPGAGPNADVRRKDSVTSLPKPASAFDRQAFAEKENLKRVAGATLGLDERERKRQQLERNRLRADGNEARTEGRDLRTGANGIRAESGEVLLGADGSRTERNGMRAVPEGTRTVADGGRSERNGMRTELDGMRTEADGNRTERDGLRKAKDGVPETANGEASTRNDKRNDERTERGTESANAGSLPVPPEGDHRTADGCGSSETGASDPKKGKGEAVRGKLTDEALRAALKAEAEEVPKLRIESNRGAEGAGVVEPRAGKKHTGGSEEELGKRKDARHEKKQGTRIGEGQDGLEGRGIGATRGEESKSDTGDGVKTKKGNEMMPKPGTLDGLGRGDPGEANVPPTERPERETLTERKNRIAARVARQEDRGMNPVGGLGGDNRRADAPKRSDRLVSDGLGASEKRPTPDGVQQSGRRPKIQPASKREMSEAMGGNFRDDKAAGPSNRHVAGGERRETVREHSRPEPMGSVRNKEAVERRPENGTQVLGSKRPKDDVSKAVSGGGLGGTREKEGAAVGQAFRARPQAEKGVPAGGSETRPRVQKRTAEEASREDVARLKRRIVEGCAKMSAQEREELVDLLRGSNKEGRSIIAGQRIKKVSASNGGDKERHIREGGGGPRVRPAEGHVASKKGFAAAFRDVAGVAEGPRESVFRDMGDAEEIERALGSFDILEKKEELAAKMDKIQSVTVKGWRCDQCRRSTEKKPDLCVSDGHPVRFCPKLVKRFWACAVCKERTDTVGKEYPDVHCRKCDGMHFKPTAMRYAVPTKETPYAARENFLAQGKEHAFSLRDE